MFIKYCFVFLICVLSIGEAMSQWEEMPLTQRIQDTNRVLQLHQQRMRSGSGMDHAGSVIAQSVATPIEPLRYRDFVTIENPPTKVKENHTLNIAYQCSQPFTIVLFVEGNYLPLSKPNVNMSMPLYRDSDVIFFRKFWPCERFPVEAKVQIPLLFPPELLRPPNLILPKVWTMKNINLKVAMVDRALWTYLENAQYLVRDPYHVAFEKSEKRMSLPIKFDHPYCRSEKAFGRSFHWPFEIFNRIFLKRQAKSPKENVVTHLLKHPIVSPESNVGLPRNFHRFINPEARKDNEFKEPRYTFSMVFFLASPCEKLCAIFQHMDDDSQYTTPIAFINDKNQIHLQAQVADNQSYAFFSDWTVPLNEWVRLDIQQYSVMVNVTLRHGENFAEYKNTVKIFHLPIIHDYEAGYFTLGASLYSRNFHGIIGSATMWRSMLITSEQIPAPSPSDEMFQIGIEDSWKESLKITSMIDQRWEILMSQTANQTKKAKQDICLPYFIEIIQPKSKETNIEQCPLESQPLPKGLCRIDNELVKLSKKRRKGLLDVQYEVGERLYDKALGLLGDTDRILKMNSVIKILNDAAKLNHGSSCFLLYVIYANGFGTKLNMTKAQRYLHIGGMSGDRMCIKTLAYKHSTGQDGFPKDDEIAFYYYFNAAQTAQFDRQRHDEAMTDVNRVRLTDERHLKQQTSEDEDLFQWLKHQAGAGMTEAKRNLGQLLYWGKQGLKRNLKAAFEYYEQAAQDTNDPNALYDYGLTLMKGHGTDINEEKGLEALIKAADQNSTKAYNTLGWYYIRQEGEENKKKAVEYFEKANELNNVDAAYNLGHMHHIGDYPGEKRNLKKAFELFYKAASQGHVESAVRVSYMMACGIRDYLLRSIQNACRWAKPVAEISPLMGEIIREALQAFRSQSWTKSTLLYLAAAETGFEPAEFNTAFLVEEDKSKLIRKNIGRDCIWRFFNTSAHHYAPPPYALNKMGDYYYYGHLEEKDLKKAIQYYVAAARMRDPQAIFNMACILEEHGDALENDTLKLLGLPEKVLKTKEDTIVELYQICSEIGSEQNSMPCYIGLIRMKALILWKSSTFLTKVIVTIAAILVSSLLILASTFLRHNRQTDNLVLTEQGTIEQGDIEMRTRIIQEEIIENETFRKASKIDNSDEESRLTNSIIKEAIVCENGGTELIPNDVANDDFDVIQDAVTEIKETIEKKGKAGLEESEDDSSGEEQVEDNGDLIIHYNSDSKIPNGEKWSVENIGTTNFTGDVETGETKKDI